MKTINPSIALIRTRIFRVESAAARRPATMHAVAPPESRLSGDETNEATGLPPAKIISYSGWAIVAIVVTWLLLDTAGLNRHVGRAWVTPSIAEAIAVE
jgi:hypothetical protein